MIAKILFGSTTLMPSHVFVQQTAYHFLIRGFMVLGDLFKKLHTAFA